MVFSSPFRFDFIAVIAFIIVCFSCTEKKEMLPIQQTDFCAQVQKNDSVKIVEVLTDFLPLMKDQTGVYVLESGEKALVARAWFAAHAEKTIDIQYFIFSTDNVGLIGCDYLVNAADRGVKVRILIDDIMVNAEIEDVLSLDAHPNIDIKIYNPGVNLGKSFVGKLKKFATDFKSANQRMHNKTFVVDGQIVITGGRNIADEYFDYDHDYNFRDRDVLLLGKATQAVSHSFDDFWVDNLSVQVTFLTDLSQNQESVDYSRLHQYACNPANFWPEARKKIDSFPAFFNQIQENGDLVWLESIRFVSDVPGKNGEEKGLGGGGLTTTALIELIKKAQQSIDIQSPYLVTTELGKQLFAQATERGVKVRILTNSLASTDNAEAFSSYQTDRQKLLDTGIQIFECKPDAAVRKRLMESELQTKLDYAPIFGLHAKTMVVDGQITVIGTFNLDPRSANLNTECIVIMENEQIARGVLEGMNEELLPENAWEISDTFNPDDQVSRAKRIKTWTRKILPKAIL